MVYIDAYARGSRSVYRIIISNPNSSDQPWTAMYVGSIRLLDASVLEKYAESRFSSGFRMVVNPFGSFCDAGRGCSVAIFESLM